MRRKAAEEKLLEKQQSGRRDGAQEKRTGLQDGVGLGITAHVETDNIMHVT